MAKAVIDLFKGWPNPSLLPAAQIKAASSQALSNPSISTPALSYGPDTGYEPLRESLASWLTDFYRAPKPISSARICITGGASQNLACILQIYTDPLYTKNVWMVSPTYYLACRIFEDNGFWKKLRAVPEDEEGIHIDFLENALSKREVEVQAEDNARRTLKPKRAINKHYRHIIYAVPTFANPSSITMSLRRRQQLVRLARKHDACIITDDVYDQLQWSANLESSHSAIDHAIQPRIVDIDRTLDGGTERDGADGFGNTVSNGSFSKILGPGSRTGWAEGTAKFAWGLSQVGSSKSGGAPSQMTSTFMCQLLQSNDLQHHIFQTLQPTYARRYLNMMSAIEKYLLPLGCTLPQSNRDVIGGYFIWLSLPEPLRAEDVVALAKNEHNLNIAPGSIFAVWGDEDVVDLDRNIRLSFSWEDEDKLAEGIERLGETVRRLMKDRQAQDELSARQS